MQQKFLLAGFLSLACIVLGSTPATAQVSYAPVNTTTPFDPDSIPGSANSPGYVRMVVPVGTTWTYKIKQIFDLPAGLAGLECAMLIIPHIIAQASMTSQSWQAPDWQRTAEYGSGSFYAAPSIGAFQVITPAGRVVLRKSTVT